MDSLAHTRDQVKLKARKNQKICVTSCGEVEK